MKLHKLATVLAFGLCILSALASAEAADDTSIRPFQVHVPEEALVDLRHRIADTRWPDMETVNDQSQGIQLAKLKPLVEYWGAGYDWRKAEAKLNALPQFMTTIDGVDIHFIHVRSRHPNALPLIMTHGWPGSVFELSRPSARTNPTAMVGAGIPFDWSCLPCGATAFLQAAVSGWSRPIAQAGRRMKLLGYTRERPGRRMGLPVSSAMARHAPEGLLASTSTGRRRTTRDCSGARRWGPARPGSPSRARSIRRTQRAGQDGERRTCDRAPGSRHRYGITIPRPASRRGCLGIQGSRTGRTTAAIPKSLRTKCSMTSPSTG